MLFQICEDEDNPANLVPGSQFTYKIQDLVQSRFWYLGMVACRRNRLTCRWEHVKTDNNNQLIRYDIHFVNGEPGDKAGFISVQLFC